MEHVAAVEGTVLVHLLILTCFRQRSKLHYTLRNFSEATLKQMKRNCIILKYSSTCGKGVCCKGLRITVSLWMAVVQFYSSVLKNRPKTNSNLRPADTLNSPRFFFHVKRLGGMIVLSSMRRLMQKDLMLKLRELELFLERWWMVVGTGLQRNTVPVFMVLA
jgi:hypothetical protein